MDNVILNDMEESIGYYKDFKRGYNELILEEITTPIENFKEAITKGEYNKAKDLLHRIDFEQAQELIAQVQEIEEYKDYNGLLVLSMNNGMGFTCKKYKEN